MTQWVLALQVINDTIGISAVNNQWYNKYWCYKWIMTQLVLVL